MGQASATRTINAPAESVWSVLADFGNVYRYHPAIKHSVLTGDADSGPGARRKCLFHDGGSVTEEITEWIDGESYTVNFTQMDMPLKTARATLSVIPVDDHTSTALVRMDYTPKWGPLGALIDAVMMRRMMNVMFSRVLAGLDHYVTTGEPIDKGIPAPAAE